MRIKTHFELDVYKMSFDAAMRIFDISKSFPKEEIYSLTDQIRRSSRSVAANIAEGYRKRGYPKLFVNKLVCAEGEAAETQSWINFAIKCGYLDNEIGNELIQIYDNILGKLVRMINQPEKWKI